MSHGSLERAALLLDSHKLSRARDLIRPALVPDHLVLAWKSVAAKQLGRVALPPRK